KEIEGETRGEDCGRQEYGRVWRVHRRLRRRTCGADRRCRPTRRDARQGRRADCGVEIKIAVGGLVEPEMADFEPILLRRILQKASPSLDAYKADGGYRAVQKAVSEM